ncbi:sterol desaturase family protein [Aliivibrio sp. S4TY2]|uniref:sterol desaturase family protein n=1 Tax=unclassified Aliivibrio TaxID=2645654 RepID=UPI0023789BDA|nr:MULTISPECIES: sterol desaturase family protein [unclassified Aliivibrio]MDD9155638.1 sterol desaturase family protein [Aliivibrio sp. S4TY2]MDD9160505.1 sterol desaturase family protein [Aliivibrio sp. S4TY1]MDD9164597.1 sterol desaturase family protein [Aliivibrio sp. S4MY2]MDD9168403.1 sterol desaturase family protein [Aliivibrio sp. S4MY4]MDD9184931.1 sterol desaturase family protein [Aliivibrio sp. S4MY3]
MEINWIEYNDPLRLGFFIVAFIIFALAEYQWPRKVLTQKKSTRWASNIGLVFFNSLILRLTLPLLAIDAAFIAQQEQWGLFNYLNTPSFLTGLLSILLLDWLIYWQHRAFHRVPLLWRLHRMHHSDQDIDVTTGTRFHPIEIIISMLVKIAAIGLLGIPVEAVILFEITLNVSAMFNHSNLFIPTWLDRYIRVLLVTPDFHRVHHSVHISEMHNNYGFFLSIWDRIGKTYLIKPIDGHKEMKIGLGFFRKEKEQRLDKMLTQPFRNK